MDVDYIKQEYEKGVSGRKIAEHLKVSHEAVYIHIRKNKFKKKNRPNLARYKTKGKTIRQIASETGWSRSSVHAQLKPKLKKGTWTR